LVRSLTPIYFGKPAGLFRLPARPGHLALHGRSRPNRDIGIIATTRYADISPERCESERVGAGEAPDIPARQPGLLRGIHGVPLHPVRPRALRPGDQRRHAAAAGLQPATVRLLQTSVHSNWRPVRRRVTVLAGTSTPSCWPVNPRRRPAIPDIALAVFHGFGGGWPEALALMVMHVGVWAICVMLLPALTMTGGGSDSATPSLPHHRYGKD
jgi:hypothetical protein